MSNLESARAAIQAEISHAKEGLTFYQSRITSLEKMLGQLADFNGSHAAGPVVKGKRGRKPGVSIVAKPTKKKAGKEATNGNDLPFTGGDYWTNLVLEEPRSASDILEAAVASLGFTPTKTQVQKLAGRMTFALNTLVKTDKIKDSGRGRERRFFKS
jgi:hypothetical protein